MQKQARKGTQSKCHNGPNCEFLKKGKCFFFHPLSERSENLTGKTQYLQSQNHQLGNLVNTLTYKVASLEKIVNALLAFSQGLSGIKAFADLGVNVEKMLDPASW